jgi:hypothetical protein
MPNNDHVDQAIDRTRLREIAEKIQVGDTDEGAEALGQLLDQARRIDGQALRRELENQAIQARLQQEGAAAIQSFTDKYPQIKDNEILADAAVGVLRKEVTADLRKAGASNEQLAEIGGDVNSLVMAHGHARARGLKELRSKQELVDAVGETMVRELGLKPAPRSDGRTVIIRGDRTVELRSEQDEAERTRKFVAEARRARGFRSY